MSIAVECPGCRAGLQVPDNLAGKRIRCKHCREEFLVTDAGSGDDYGEPQRRRPKRKGWSALEASLFTVSIVFGGLLIAVGVVKAVQRKIDAITDDNQPQPVAVSQVPGRPRPMRVGINAGGGGVRPAPRAAAAPAPRVVTPIKPTGANGRPAEPPDGPMVGKLANLKAAGKDASGRPIYTVDYAVENAPGFGEWYYVIVKGPGGVAQTLIPALFTQKTGTVSLTFDPAFDPGPAFQLWLEREPVGKPAERVKVSKPVTMG